MSELEKYFDQYRKNIVGINQSFEGPYGKKKVIYADWIASGRLYEPIEKIMTEKFGPFVGNTHSESSMIGTTMTHSYCEAKRIIKKHVNAGPEDVIIFSGYGMTAAINKFQRLLGLRISEQIRKFTHIPKDQRSVVFLTHMEHHSNHTSWLETMCDVNVIEPDKDGLVDLNNLEDQLKQNSDRKLKIGSFTAASNVTGIQPPYYKMAKLMHEYGGLCFIDFAAAAPYVNIDMHPLDPKEKLDAIFFSPHKFLGGPGTSGVLIFSSELYHHKIPDHPGGGTVNWTNPWGGHQYVKDIELREDGGTPGFLQAIRTALVIKLKEKIEVNNILEREHELLKNAFSKFKNVSSIQLLASNVEERLGVISFYIEDIHYNLLVKLLNDRYGIQVRGGCSCAGTYGHYLLHVDPLRSKKITNKIARGDFSEKPGWVRLSIHPTMTDDELDFIINAIEETIGNVKEWVNDYTYSSKTNEFYNKKEQEPHKFQYDWFNME
jgi:selenocysteine lyase/cysteine desulfurase